MRLYLAQHGEAVSENVDPKRPLTPKGIQDVTRTAQFLKSSGIKIDMIWHSAKTRAIETAQIFSKILLPKDGTKQKEGLTPNSPVEEVFNDVLSSERDLMIVGHLPFLQKLASLALIHSDTPDIIGFRQGGIICLDRRYTGEWQLIFAIPPEILKGV